MSPGTSLVVGLIADHNVHNLAAILQKGKRIKVTSAPFGQTTGVLLDRNAEFWKGTYDAVVVWTAPERAVPEFAKTLASESFSMATVIEEVRRFAQLLGNIPSDVRTVVVPSWSIPGSDRGQGPLDLHDGFGVAGTLMRMNVALADAVRDTPRVVLLDSQRWIASAGAGGYNAKLWYMSKTLFHTNVFAEAAQDIVAVMEAAAGHTKKVVLVDLDNTLWGGIVGDAGWENLRLGGHDPAGEAFVDFQKGIKRLINRGVLVGVVSKNEESTALAAIRNHPDMVLKVEDLAGWRINWNDKAANIQELMSELNLGLDSAVFLDDSPFERARVRETLPNVLVPDLPEDAMQLPGFLGGLRCFDAIATSSEDKNRTRMYVAERARTELKKDSISLDEWLMTLELGVAGEPLNKENLQRVAQLLNKTNQMNMSTRRLTSDELLAWSQQMGHRVWAFRVWDRFGDYGICGITSLAQEGTAARLTDFVLSCRVMGRGVEDAILLATLQQARKSGCSVVTAEYIPTPKNEPCNKWLQQSKADEKDGNRYLFQLGTDVMSPAHIRLSFKEANEEVSV